MVCVQLSLHDESRWPDAITVCEQEARRRLWWSIYRLEIHTACVLGIVRTPESRCGVGYPTGTHHPGLHSWPKWPVRGLVRWVEYDNRSLSSAPACNF
ncbi:hypothetical protein BDW62DRAFT_179688 [Aspergillus aurantiobrunneus]